MLRVSYLGSVIGDAVVVEQADHCIPQRRRHQRSLPNMNQARIVPKPYVRAPV